MKRFIIGKKEDLSKGFMKFGFRFRVWKVVVVRFICSGMEDEFCFWSVFIGLKFILVGWSENEFKKLCICWLIGKVSVCVLFSIII